MVFMNDKPNIMKTIDALEIAIKYLKEIENPNIIRDDNACKQIASRAINEIVLTLFM